MLQTGRKAGITNLCDLKNCGMFWNSIDSFTAVIYHSNLIIFLSNSNGENEFNLNDYIALFYNF